MQLKTKKALAAVLLILGVAAAGRIYIWITTPKQIEVLPQPKSKPEIDSVKKTIIAVAKEKGIKPSSLLAMADLESSMGTNVLGDSGCSHGTFQINTCPNANPQAKSVLGDLQRETEWVADRLISYGYKDGYITLAFAKYNAPANPNFNYAELVKVRIPKYTKYDEA